MDKDIKARIESMVWNYTVGSGKTPDDDLSNEPDEEAMKALAITLGRPLTHEEENCAILHWRQCYMELSFP